VTANNRIVPADSSIYVTNFEDQGYRAQRITELLSASTTVSVNDFARIQADVYSIPASILTPYFIRAGSAAGGDAATASGILSGWDDNMVRTSPAAAVYEMAVSELLRNTVEPLLGKDLYSIYRSNVSASVLYSVLINQARDARSSLFSMLQLQLLPVQRVMQHLRAHSMTR